MRVILVSFKIQVNLTFKFLVTFGVDDQLVYTLQMCFLSIFSAVYIVFKFTMLGNKKNICLCYWKFNSGSITFYAWYNVQILQLDVFVLCTIDWVLSCPDVCDASLSSKWFQNSPQCLKVRFPDKVVGFKNTQGLNDQLTDWSRI